MAFVPRLDILLPAQRRLWDELNFTPSQFVLYGGTALALRLAHRDSKDFDFFSSESFEGREIEFTERIPYLHGASISQVAPNTLTAKVERGGTVQVSFFGGLNLNRVDDPDEAGGVSIASPRDIAGMKVATIWKRAEAKDYLDIAALLATGLALPVMLSAARAIYGPQFNPLVSLKALSYFEDGNLPSLPDATRRQLRRAVADVDLSRLPVIVAHPGLKRSTA